jgi:DNA polymerase III alpha subunit (gram-positive type)
MSELSKKPLAITDIETTGFDFLENEIIEIGLILVHQKNLKILDKFETKIKPQRIETALKESLEFNGYNEKDWENALDLKSAMKIYSEKTKDSIFLAHNITFDYPFIFKAFKETGIKDKMDYHRIDSFTLAWAKASKMPDLKGLSLSKLCSYFGIPEEPMPHRAINGAFSILKVFLNSKMKCNF